MKLSWNKKMLIILLLGFCMTFIVVRGITSYMFYKRAFNWTIYYNLCLVDSNCNYFYKTIDEITEKGKADREEIEELYNFFYGAMEGLQQLNEYSDKAKCKHNVDLTGFVETTYYIDSLKSKLSIEDGQLILEDEEINSLKEIKVPFETIHNLVEKETKGVLNGANYRDDNVIKDGLWLRVLTSIEVELCSL